MAKFEFKESDTDHNILVADLEIENEEVFHMKNLYKMIHDWLIEEGYTDIYGGPTEKAWHETFYLERVLGSGAKEHRIWWRCIRTPNSNGYYRYYLKIDFMTLNMKSMEVMHQGHKMKTDKGDCIIKIKSYIQLDFGNTWKKGIMGSLNKVINLDRIFRNRIYKAQIEAYKVDLYKTSYRLQNIIKQYLKLKTLYEMPRPFHPEKGL